MKNRNSIFVAIPSGAGLPCAFANNASCSRPCLTRLQYGGWAKRPCKRHHCAANTAVGWFSLFVDTEGSFNTAAGAGSLLFISVNNNTALGAAALLFNITGSQNTAVGAAALVNNDNGSRNSALGSEALTSNTTGDRNTAIGFQALVLQHHRWSSTRPAELKRSLSTPPATSTLLWG